MNGFNAFHKMDMRYLTESTPKICFLQTVLQS